MLLPWARPGSGFTLLFEALVIALAKQMPIAPLAALVGESDTRIWRIVHHYVDEARAREDLADVQRIGVDDTSARRGQDYVTVFADLDQRRVIFVAEGRKASTYGEFVTDLHVHGGDAEQIAEVTQDMSEAYLSGALTHLPNAEITFDRFHIKAHLSQAVDAVRRAERRAHKDVLKNTRYLWLRRPQTLTDRQRDWLDELLAQPLKTARAYELALRFDDAYDLDEEDAGPYLRAWCQAARDSGLTPMADFADMIEEYWLGVIAWWRSRVSNGLLEGINSLIQTAKRRARGYRSKRNYIAMIYLTVGKLDLQTTHTE